MLASSARRAFASASSQWGAVSRARRAAWPSVSRSMSVEAKALTYEKRGETITIVEEFSTLSSPSGNQALLKFLAAPITRADYDVIHASGESSMSLDIKEVPVRFAKAQEIGVLDPLAGVVGKLPDLPAVGGLQGVAVVEEVGPAVKGLKPGDWVIPATGLGTWRSHALLSEDDLAVVPSDIPMEYAAVLSRSPCAALRLLEDFVALKEGDCILVNACNGLVGQTILQLAAARGIKAIGIMRGRPGYEEICPHLVTLGAAVVVTDAWSKHWQMKDLMAGLPPPKVAFDGAGGNGGAAVANLLPKGATLVKYGSASQESFRVAAERDIKVETFSLAAWEAAHSKADKEAMLAQLATMVREKKLQLLLERAFFDRYKTALKMGVEAMRNRQLVMCITEPNWPVYPEDYWEMDEDAKRLGISVQ